MIGVLEVDEDEDEDEEDGREVLLTGRLKDRAIIEWEWEWEWDSSEGVVIVTIPVLASLITGRFQLI